jgi:hypothetical protein
MRRAMAVLLDDCTVLDLSVWLSYLGIGDLVNARAINVSWCKWAYSASGSQRWRDECLALVHDNLLTFLSAALNENGRSNYCALYGCLKDIRVYYPDELFCSCVPVY